MNQLESLGVLHQEVRDQLLVLWSTLALLLPSHCVPHCCGNRQPHAVEMGLALRTNGCAEASSLNASAATPSAVSAQQAVH